MKVTFQGKEVGNYSGFVRVKAGKPASQGEVVILPFEVEVASGTYSNRLAFFHKMFFRGQNLLFCKFFNCFQTKFQGGSL